MLRAVSMLLCPRKRVQAVTEHQPDQELDIVCCAHCDWPIRRDEQYAIIYGPCPDCEQIVPKGVVHTLICAFGWATGQPKAVSQKRRAGLLRMN